MRPPPTLRAPGCRAPALLLFLALAGCGGGSPPRPADPDAAREALQTALDAWQRGDSPASLQGRRPPIHVVDHDWGAGLRLARFELGADTPSGADRWCPVRLWFPDRRGKAVPRTAAYRVGTHPALTVVREDQ